MQSDQKEMNNKLKQELTHYSFSGSKAVLKRTHPKKFGERINHWWNKEVTIPLIPIGVATILLISISVSPILIGNENKIPERQLIQIGGSFYWKDLVEGVSK